MDLFTEKMMLAVMLPLMLAYILALTGYVMSKGEKKGFVLTISVRDSALLAVALDMPVALRMFEFQNAGISSDGISFTLVSSILLLIHFSIFVYAEKKSNREDEDVVSDKKSFILKNIVDTYIALLCLVTNATSISALLNIGGA